MNDVRCSHVDVVDGAAIADETPGSVKVPKMGELQANMEGCSK